MLFRTVTLRTREDAHELLGFLKHPTSAVAQYIDRVVVSVQQVSGLPWIHLMSTNIRTRLRNAIFGLHVSLQGPLPPGQKSLRSMHDGLPRSLPHFSRLINRLSLSDLHFERLEDLMHTVWEMRDLKRISCFRVTWGSLPTVPSRRKCLHGVFAHTITMSQCAPSQTQAGVWVSTWLHHRDIPFFSTTDLAGLLALADVLEKAFVRVDDNARQDIHISESRYRKQ